MSFITEHHLLITTIAPDCERQPISVHTVVATGYNYDAAYAARDALETKGVPTGRTIVEVKVLDTGVQLEGISP